MNTTKTSRHYALVMLILIGGLALGTCLIAMFILRPILIQNVLPALERQTPPLPKSRPLVVPDGVYLGVAWLDGEQLAFLYLTAPPTEPTVKSLHAINIMLVTLGTGETRFLERPIEQECYIDRIQGLMARLPNGNLGFMFECLIEQGSVVDQRSSLYMWDRHADTLHLLYRYPLPFAATAFSFAPEMSRWIQENAIGGGLDNQLYRVRSDGEMTRLLPHFQRAARPEWSEDGQWVAFWGTETYPGGKSADFKTFGEIEGLFRYPWDLYMMDPEGSQVHVVVPQVKSATHIKWVPQRRWLSFTGTYQNQPGLWVINPETKAMTRLWDSFAYDWSPDGQRIVTFQNRHASGLGLIQPVILDAADLKLR